MKIKKFQRNIKKLSDYTPVSPDGLLPAIWTSEESGEVLKEFKHSLKTGDDLDDDAIMEEMGDTITSLALLANERGYKMKDILKNAQDKLAKRTGKSLED